MPNPYKTAEEKKKVSPGGKRQEEQPQVEETVAPVAKSNPLAGMIASKPESKSYGFYLSDEAVAKLEKLAKQNKCSKSKALDMLLKSIL